MTAAQWATEIRGLLSDLFDSDVVVFINPVIELGQKIGWPSVGLPTFLKHFDQPTADDYLHWLTSGHYSAVLSDGALLQLTAEWQSNVLTYQRLAYIPCPVDLTGFPVRDWNDGLADIVEMLLDGGWREFRLASMVRFDYDLEASSTEHPASHLTINSPSCRVPCIAPMRLAHFVDFVFRQFYPEVWEHHAFLRTLSRKEEAWSPLPSGQLEQAYVTWQRMSASG